MSLVLAGLAGIAFFWLTDPKWGWGHGASPADIVDAMNQAAPGRWIGIAGCTVVMVIGLWLVLRRVA